MLCLSTARLLTLPLSLLLPLSALAESPWRKADTPHTYTFPRDHHSHPDFKTEWWYLTGHLYGEEGQEFGYQLTFFRQGLRPPAERSETESKLILNDLHFGHFAISDITNQSFHFDQTARRGSFGDAGTNPDSNPLIWIDNWEISNPAPDTFHIKATMKDGTALELNLVSKKAPVFHGKDGISAKSHGPNPSASHYYTYTRLSSEGTLTKEDKTISVTGQSWMDREWSTSALTEEQTGWDWFSLQFADNSELMLFGLREKDSATLHPFRSGTYIDAAGKSHPLSVEEIELVPLDHWTSETTEATYPTSWKISVPSHGIDLTTKAAMQNQELLLPPIVYWEGAIKATGSHSGDGYLEMTGYAAPFSELK